VSVTVLLLPAWVTDALPLRKSIFYALYVRARDSLMVKALRYILEHAGLRPDGANKIYSI
jgi:hypothetical protein